MALLICGLAMPAWVEGNGMGLDDAIRSYEATTHQTFRGGSDGAAAQKTAVYTRPSES